MLGVPLFHCYLAVSIYIPLTLYLLSYLITLPSYSLSSNLSSAERLSQPTKVACDMRNDSISRGRPRMPVYFLSIGGPNFIENKNHPAYLQLETIGKEITTRVNPKAVVVFSAHWQESSSKLKINAAEHTNIIYDFYGFPPEYYEIEYPYVGDPQIAEQVAKKLSAAGIQTESTERGLDHGIWVGFLAGMLR